MPAVILFRHGKSDWDADYGGDDRDRPLSSRGRKASSAMGEFLARTGNVPDAVVTSPAQRAVDTLHLAMQAGGWICPVEEREALYGASAATVLGEIRGAPPDADLLLVVGHEPTSSDAAALLIGGGRVRMPTAAMVRIDLPVNRWADTEPGSGELAWLVIPKLLD